MATGRLGPSLVIVRGYVEGVTGAEQDHVRTQPLLMEGYLARETRCTRQFVMTDCVEV